MTKCSSGPKHPYLYCMFHPWKKITLQLPFDQSNAAFLDEWLTFKNDVYMHLVDCNEEVCRDFLSLLVHRLGQLSFKNSLGRKPSVCFYLCSLDRTCLYWLARLRPAWNVNVYFGYGTKIVAFENAKDLNDWFKLLCLNSVVQQDIHIHPDDEKEVLNRIQEHKTGERRKIAERNQPDRHVKLEFGFGSKNETDMFVLWGLESIRRTGSFELGVNLGETNFLSPIAGHALQVPTVKLFTNSSGAFEPFNTTIVENLKQRPASSEPLEINITRRCSNGLTNTVVSRYFNVTNELLGIFNEKRLTCLDIDLSKSEVCCLLEKVLSVMTVSVHFERLYIDIRHPDPLEHNAVYSFFNNLARQVIPRLVRPFELIINSQTILSQDPAISPFFPSIREIILGLDRLRNKDLQNLAALVGAKLGMCYVSFKSFWFRVQRI